MHNAIRQQGRSATRCKRLGSLLAFVFRIQERWQQRRHLEELDDHLLADIGLKPEDVRRECWKAFWHQPLSATLDEPTFRSQMNHERTGDPHANYLLHPL